MDRMQLLLQELDLLNFPKNSYVIVGSGSLAIRGIREPQDLDIVVNDELWDKLVLQYGIKTKENGTKVVILSDNIEALGKGTFPKVILNALTANEQVSSAEIIKGYPFQSVEHFRFFKGQGERQKDLDDVKLLNEWLENNKAF